MKIRVTREQVERFLERYNSRPVSIRHGAIYAPSMDSRGYEMLMPLYIPESFELDIDPSQVVGEDDQDKFRTLKILSGLRMELKEAKEKIKLLEGKTD